MPGPGEPLWLPDDTEKALAYENIKRELCERCHTREADWFAEDGKRHDPPLLEADVRRCEGCAEKARLQLDIDRDVRRSTNGQAETAGRATAGLYVALGPYKAED